MKIDTNKESGTSVGVYGAKKSSVVNVPCKVCHGIEGQVYMWGIMYGEKEASEDLDY